MLIATFTALMMLFGGVDSPYIIPKADKLVLEQIDDKARKKELKTLIKTYNTEYKSFKKWEKSFQKIYKNLSELSSTSSKALQLQVDEYAEQQRALDSKLIPIRLDIMSKLTEDEWSQFIDKVVLQPEKKRQKKEKQQIKAELKQNESMKKFRADIINTLEDEAHLDLVNSAIDRFENRLADISFEEQNLFVGVVELVANQKASEAELQTLTDSYIKANVDLSYAYIELRETLIAEINPEDWKKTHKALSKLL